jgi:hypothetical protein
MGDRPSANHMPTQEETKLTRIYMYVAGEIRIHDRSVREIEP